MNYFADTVIGVHYRSLGRRTFTSVVSYVLLAVAWCSAAYSQPAGEDQAAEFPTLTAESPEGSKLFAERCAACHEHPHGNVPPVFVLGYKSPEAVINALTVGKMRPMAAGLGAEQIRAIATHLTHREPGTAADPDVNANRCAEGRGRSGPRSADWNGAGKDIQNSRFQSSPGITPDRIKNLKLRWAFAYPGGNAYGSPVVVAGVLYITTALGDVLALDAETGCTRWNAKADAPVRTAVFVGSTGTPNAPANVFFGDERAAAYALDAQTGSRKWKTQIDASPTARIVGSPVLYEGTLYVPVSSMDEGSAYDPTFECCKFRGQLAAIDASTGATKWIAYMIPKPASQLKEKNSAGTPMFGPSGAAIWAAPTIDPKRNLVYVATGNGYNNSEAGATNAIVALDLRTGHRLWEVQPTPADDPYTKCHNGEPKYCEVPEVKQTEYGQKVPERMEFGSSPVLTPSADKDLLVIGQKSGVLYALDPDRDGRVVWETRVGAGGLLGGVMYGLAADTHTVYVSVADRTARSPYSPGGLSAINLSDGRRLWRSKPPPPICSWGAADCSSAQPGATTAIPGVVFSGALDGHIRAHSADSGAILWDFDTGRTFEAVNGGTARGGAINGNAQIVSGGFLYVNSGGSLLTHPGNALLAFSVDSVRRP
ncbi:MAG: PQQ-binding-like beta-propeller repeat protein [Proteobacteria bacterium]|nr:PQQ-binding-like beta-propeller repeat protein [Pseudomonadota bacterium]